VFAPNSRRHSSRGRVGIAIAAACAAFALFLAGGAAHAAAFSPAPVQLLDCKINHRSAFVDPYKSVTIAFVNRGDGVVDDVHFRIRYADRTADLSDKGTFAKDVSVDHTFRAFWNVLFAGSTPASCSVEYVHFANGRSWAAAEATP
jgi:hypothetical protein